MVVEFCNLTVYLGIESVPWLLSIDATNGKDGSGLKSDTMPAKITEKLPWLVLPDEISS